MPSGRDYGIHGSHGIQGIHGIQERDDYEKQIEALKKKGQRSSVQDKEQEQMKAQSI